MINKAVAIFLVFACLLAVFALPPPAICIEELSNAEMQAVTGQAGISAAVDNVPLYLDYNGIKFQDAETIKSDGMVATTPGYVKFDVLGLLLLKNTLDLDIGVFVAQEQLSFEDQTGSDTWVTQNFDHPLNDLAMIALRHGSTGPGSICNFENISVYDHDSGTETLLGALNFSAVQIHESYLHLFPPPVENGVGIRAVGGARVQISSVVYENPAQAASVNISGIMMGAAFTGDELPEGASSTNEIDTSTWAFDTGVFELGIPYYFHDNPDQEDTTLYSYPFSLDITTDDTRSGDFQSYMAINAPVRGAIRIKNVSFSNDSDMGPIAIDGIRMYKNYIEFPGRGIGN
ncbi:MAG: hypothetical protein K9K82_13315 [Desulfobacteraceae bacterium]|nr:hypothetical protein [Desulfobacteraceae bacterium]